MALLSPSVVMTVVCSCSATLLHVPVTALQYLQEVKLACTVIGLHTWHCPLLTRFFLVTF